MRIVRTWRRPPADTTGAAVALGNFDGVHRGHRAVLAAAVQAAADRAALSAVLTFEPHPRSLFHPGGPGFRLTPFRAKAARIRDSGIDVLFLARFDRAFAARTADAFVRAVLVDGLRARHVIAGYDFVFGKDRGGNVERLRTLAADHGFGLTVVGPVVEADAKPYASRDVRELLRAGKPAAAAQLLGHNWEIVGRVRRGDGRGRGLGYPTANLDLAGWLLPRFGIYAVRVRIGADPARRAGVASIGVRPMFATEEPLLEAHLFDYDADLRGKLLCVELVEYLRPEEKFPTLDALRAAMDADSARARTLLRGPEAGQPVAAGG